MRFAIKTKNMRTHKLLSKNTCCISVYMIFLYRKRKYVLIGGEDEDQL